MRSKRMPQGLRMQRYGSQEGAASPPPRTMAPSAPLRERLPARCRRWGRRWRNPKARAQHPSIRGERSWLRQFLREARRVDDAKVARVGGHRAGIERPMRALVTHDPDSQRYAHGAKARDQLAPWLIPC